MIININGWPGVGKLTVAQRLKEVIGGRLLDNHTIFNGLQLMPVPNRRVLRDRARGTQIAFARASKLPPDVPLTLTSAYADTSFGRENWAAIRALASARSSLLCNIVLDCSLDETSDGSNHRNALNYGSSLSQKCLLQRAKLLNRWRPEVITAFD